MDELDLAYMSIETLKSRVAALETEIDRLRAANDAPHPASPGWSGDIADEYSRGFRGHGY